MLLEAYALCFLLTRLLLLAYATATRANVAASWRAWAALRCQKRQRFDTKTTTITTTTFKLPASEVVV
eukprot:6177912-Pleurochrysis_carterae.AAC.2